VILCIRADTSEVYIGLWQDNQEVASKSWVAGRELSVQILQEIKLLSRQLKITLQHLDGIVVYEGPGSYTGLRISISVANTIGYSYTLAVVGSTGHEWIVRGLENLKNTEEFIPISPVYGGEVYTTKPKK